MKEKAKIIQQKLKEKELDEELITLIEKSSYPSFLCETKINVPNYLSIVYVNKKFTNFFAMKDFLIIGKNYDFLFSSIDPDKQIEDKSEYIRLIEAIKNNKQVNVEIFIPAYNQKFKINYTPYFIGKNIYSEKYAIFSFDPIKISNDSTEFAERVSKSNIILLKNIERTLRIERLLREVANLILSDVNVEDIARNISRILYDYLKCDRIIVHDYNNGKTNFFIEYCDKNTKKILDDKNNQDQLRKTERYVNFHNYFYQKVGNKNNKSSLYIINDTLNDNNLFEIRDVFEELNIRSQIGVTTSFANKINGGIYIHQSEQRIWLEEEIELIEAVAEQFSIAIDRSYYVEKILTTNHALMEKTMQLKESLKHEQEMRKIQNEFIALVSHEFKTPLQIIDGTRELIQRKSKNSKIDNDLLEKNLEKIKYGVDRMNGLINSTLNLAKLESDSGNIRVEIEKIDLISLVKDILHKNISLAQNKNIEIISRFSDIPEYIFSDKKFLEHIVTNVISNSIKYSRSDSVVKVILKANKENIAIRIIDYGIGIPKSDINKIGNKFYRATNSISISGTGIGLYLTKYFTELLNGSFSIESEQNIGTTVTIIIPLSKY